MKAACLLLLAATASAFVIPDQQVFYSLALEDQDPPAQSLFDNVPSPEDAWNEAEETMIDVADRAKDKFRETVDNTFDRALRFSKDCETWFNFEDYVDDLEPFDDPLHDDPSHRPPPHHGPGKRPGKRPPHKKPHRPPHHHKPNKTVYEIISKSKYTTKLAKLINEFPDLVDLLNGTSANFTVFAPTDKAFERIPKHHPKPSKDFLKKLLTYHISPEFYPTGRIFVTRTIPTAFAAEHIGNAPQRLSTQVGLRGLTVNFYARVVGANYFGTNGVIHGINSILVPPPNAVDIISYLPGKFSTFNLALVKTGLLSNFNDTSTHTGGTLFAPSNLAFKKLGPKINAFLFSKYGQKYLKALTLYHAVANFTLYSDAYYPAESQKSIPKDRFHAHLETCLEGKYLSIDVARFGRLVDLRINGYTDVAVLDIPGADGVIQVVPNVLIPPKTPGVAEDDVEDLTIEELKERLEPYIEDEDKIEL